MEAIRKRQVYGKWNAAWKEQMGGKNRWTRLTDWIGGQCVNGQDRTTCWLRERIQDQMNGHTRWTIVPMFSIDFINRISVNKKNQHINLRMNFKCVKLK